jgi:hypothetical protein
MGRATAIGLNLGLRALMVAFAAEAIIWADDPRFEGKGIGIRNAMVIGSYSLVLPAIHWLRRPWSAYPWWTDVLWLSVPFFDMLGNSLNLYDTYRYFDLLPHVHGPGAATVVLMELARLPLLASIGIVQVGHILLEGQEYYTDVLLGTQNITEIADPINDMLVGVLGSVLYGLVYQRLRHGKVWRGWR